jgi:hypothetical protein
VSLSGESGQGQAQTKDQRRKDDAMVFMQRPTSFTPSDFAALGSGGVAYVKPVIHDGQPAYGIFGADGTAMAIATSRDLALAAIKQNDLEPLDAH